METQYCHGTWDPWLWNRRNSTRGSLLRARTRDVLLAIVIYPVIVPVIMGGVKATTAILQPDMAVADFELWARILLTLMSFLLWFALDFRATANRLG